LGDFEAINQELLLFNPALSERPQIVVLNKLDLPQAQEQWPAVEAAMQERGLPVMAISAVTGENVQALLYRVQAMFDELPPLEIDTGLTEDLAAEVAVSPEEEKAFHIIAEDEGIWRVEGIAIERAAQMTNWDYYEAAMRFQRILRALGITDALREAGVQEGDTVQIGPIELVWGYENAFD
jgi:GTP-binding protein